MGQASRLSTDDGQPRASRGGPTSNPLLVARNPKEIASPYFQRGHNDIPGRTLSAPITEGLPIADNHSLTLELSLESLTECPISCYHLVNWAR